MKSKLFLFVILVAWATTSNAAIWRVNNMSGADPDFVTIQGAIDSVSPGDILYVEGGIYDGFTLNKPLSIIGSGFGNMDNSEVETPLNPTQISSDVYLVPGAQGSYITGCNLKNAGAVLYLQTTDIIISRCNLYYTYFKTLMNNYKTNIGNVSFSGSIIKALLLNNDGIDDTLCVSNVNISNSVITGRIFLNSYENDYSFSGTFNQCVFLTNNIITTQCLYKNSIFYADDYSSASQIDDGFNNSTSYCIYLYNYTLGFGESNCLSGITDLFSTGGYNTLSDTTPAKGFGDHGQDVGIYGGDNPFVPGGYAPVPTITKLNMPTQVNGTIHLNMKAKVLK
ncbi:MAG: hypothetical protein PHH37_10820 [Paludibacter sp.]|nr:hypothetical protein [Paludibacter sp.]